MDDPLQLAEGYEPEIIWDGLNFVDFSIVPHYQSDHSEAATAEQATSFLRTNGYSFRTMRDGDVFIKNGADLMFLSY